MPRSWLKHADPTLTSRRQRRFVKPHNCSCGKGHGYCTREHFSCAPPNHNKAGSTLGEVAFDSRGRVLSSRCIVVDDDENDVYAALSEAELSSIHPPQDNEGEGGWCAGCFWLTDSTMYEDPFDPGVLYCAECWKGWAQPEQAQARGSHGRGSKERTFTCSGPNCGNVVASRNDTCRACQGRPIRQRNGSTRNCTIVKFGFDRTVNCSVPNARHEGWQKTRRTQQPITPAVFYCRL